MKIKMKHLIIAAIVKKVIFAVIALFFFTSCSFDRDDFSVVSIDSVSLKESSMNDIILNVGMVISNKSSSAMVIKHSEFKLYDTKGKEMCDATIIEPIKVKKGENLVEVPIKVVFNGGLLGAARIVGLITQDIDNMFISGKIKASKGIITINRGIDKVKVSELK